MRVPIEWLREFIEIPDAQIEAAADELTMAGLEVEETIFEDGAPVWVTKITPNRGDWASIYGTARELAAIAPGRALKPLPAPETFGSDGGARVRIEDSNGCARFHAIVIEGVTIGPAPAWVQARLRAALGERYRPINNVADITNLVMLETGQPLHAFDFDTIPGGQIVVRLARPGERLVTLDGSEHTLPEGTLCICDRERALSIAGVMGGQDTEITEKTTRVLLETAHFDPLSIRRAAKKTLRSEASFRFERYVDPALVPIAGWRCARLIVEIAGGRITGGVDQVARPAPKRRVLARFERIRRLLGADVDRDDAIAALERLGIEVTRSAGALDCGIPSWRPDLTIEDDIAEEVGRIALGYANLPERVSWQIGGRGQDSPRGVFVRRVREVLLRAGLQEVVTHSLTTPEAAGEGALTLRNPMSVEYSALRTSLVPNLLTIAARASLNGQKDFALFEVGPVYRSDDAGGVHEPLRIAALVSGSVAGGAWGVRPESWPADFYYAKGVVEALLAALGIENLEVEAGQDVWLHPYRAALLSVQGVRIGTVGELAEGVCISNDVARRTCLFDLDGDALASLARERSVAAVSVPRFPSVVRDIAPVFGPGASYGAIAARVREAAGALLESLSLTDRFEGAALGAGRAALTLRLTFRSAERTLTEGEVEAALEGVRAAIIGMGGELRS